MRVASRIARTSECCGPSLSMLACVVIVKPSSPLIHMAGAPTSTILSGAVTAGPHQWKSRRSGELEGHADVAVERELPCEGVG